MKKKSGFTLVEMMIVVMITGMLAAIALPTMASARDRTNRTTCQSNLRLLNETAQQYLFVNPDPGTLSTADLKEYFFREREPTCPSGGEYSVSTDPSIIPACTLSITDAHQI